MVERVPDTTSEFVLDMARRELRRGGVRVHVEPKVFDLIALLVRHPLRVVETREISAELWPNENVCDGALRQCVWSARRALRDTAKDSRFIRTVHRWGYRFIGRVVIENETSIRLCRFLSELYDGPALSSEGRIALEQVS